MAGEEGRMRRAWTLLFGVVAATGIVAVPVVSTVGVSSGHPPIIRVRQGTSTNWSGYAAYGAPGTFKSVSATWTQPAVTCSSQNTYSSYWVGLDGYNNSSVEQLGTEADCSSGSPRYYSWYEMYPRPSYLAGVTVTPTHTYSASVTAGARGSFLLTLKDVTTGKSFSTSQKLNQAQGASAEVVVEAPYSGGVLPLANYGQANFTGSMANGVGIGNFYSNVNPNTNVDAITMLNPYGMKSTPTSLTGNQNFSVKWSAS
jgi:hypothetical protein